MSLKLALVLLVFDPYALNSFAQPKALLSNAFDWALLGVLIALATRYLRHMPRWSPLHIPVVAFALTYAIAAALALDTRVALFGTADRGLGLIAMLDNVFLTFATVLLVRTTRDATALAASLASATLVVLSYEMLQWVGLDAVWERDRNNLFSTLGNRGVLAQVLGVASISSASVAISPGTSGGTSGHQGATRRLLAAGLTVLAVGGVFLSGGRAALLGMALGGMVVTTIWIAWQGNFRTRGATVVAAVAIVISATALALPSPVGQRALAFVQQLSSVGIEGMASQDLSLSSRLDFYRVAAQMLGDRPLLGVGPDNFGVAFPRYRTPESNRLHDAAVPQTSPHSVLAKVATDSGLLGLFFFLASILTALYLALKGPRSPERLAAAGAIAAFLGTGLISVDHVAAQWVPWLAFGLIAAPDLAVSATSDPSSRGRRYPTLRNAPARGRLGPVALTAIGAGFFLAVLSTKDPISAAHDAQTARAALAPGNERLQRLALDAARRATDLDSGRAEYWDLAAEAYFRLGDPKSAERAWLHAWSLAPFQAIYLANAGKAQLRQGFDGDNSALRAALDTAERAEAVDRYVPDVQYTLAIAAAAVGDPERTIAAAELWRSLGGSPDASIAEAAAVGYLRQRQSADAERWIRAALPYDRPDQPKLRLLLAQAFLGEDRRNEAMQQIELVLLADPKNQEANRLKAALQER